VFFHACGVLTHMLERTFPLSVTNEIWRLGFNQPRHCAPAKVANLYPLIDSAKGFTLSARIAVLPEYRLLCTLLTQDRSPILCLHQAIPIPILCEAARTETSVPVHWQITK
jgi:hypothetical protein